MDPRGNGKISYKNKWTEESFLLLLFFFMNCQYPNKKKKENICSQSDSACWVAWLDVVQWSAVPIIVPMCVAHLPFISTIQIVFIRILFDKLDCFVFFAVLSQAAVLRVLSLRGGLRSELGLLHGGAIWVWPLEEAHLRRRKRKMCLCIRTPVETISVLCLFVFFLSGSFSGTPVTSLTSKTGCKITWLILFFAF